MRFFIYFWFISSRRNLCRIVVEFSNDISTPLIEEGSNDLCAVLQQQQGLRLDTLPETLEQAHAVLGAQIKDLNKSLRASDSRH
ncbi:hypothetical protein INT48_006288 [Thamnidium elegans]|uniref:Uncharacterized protein n=1 Tax=Thamnidium elegans TaxID=101142 RepID=A0A8H7SKU4_9FUNG|nr:hypothetical protein INT48_006288 [Thamnidium elegans]